jgi:hypothetical protein
MRLVLSKRLFVLIAVLPLTCVGCNEVQKKQFQNLDAAQQEHMIEKGWIPASTPQDAKDINVESDLDAASVYGSYVSGNTDVLNKHCSSVEDSFQMPLNSPKWFQNDLGEADTAGKLKSKGYKVLNCDGGFNLAIFSPERRVDYWSVRK